MLKLVEHEFNAIHKTLRFFSDHPIPEATIDNAPIYMAYTSEYAKVRTFEDFLNKLDLLGEGEYDPRNHFGKLYDQLHAYWNAPQKLIQEL